MTTIGRSVTSRYERNSASRVALPAMNCPLTAAAQSIAIKGDEGRRGVGEIICNPKEAPLASSSRSRSSQAGLDCLDCPILPLARLSLEPPSPAGRDRRSVRLQPDRGRQIVRPSGAEYLATRAQSGNQSRSES